MHRPWACPRRRRLARSDHWVCHLLNLHCVLQVLANKIDALSYMFPLTIQHVRQIECEEGLVSAHDEEVGVAL